MPTFRERLAGLVRRTAARTVGRLRPFLRPARPATPRPPARPEPAKPVVGAGPAPSLPARIQEDLETLSNMVVATNAFVARLRDAGYAEAAEAVLGVPGPPQAEPPPAEPPPPFEPPPILPPPDEPPPDEPDEPPEEPPDGPEARYLLQGSVIFLPLLQVDNAWDQLIQTWKDAMIGSPREAGVPTDDVPRYAPDAVAKGGPLDPGTQIPPEALRSRGAFTRWAQDNGFDEGLSIEIDGLLAPPGRRPTPAYGRSRWSPPEEGTDQ